MYCRNCGSKVKTLTMLEYFKNNYFCSACDQKQYPTNFCVSCGESNINGCLWCESCFSEVAFKPNVYCGPKIDISLLERHFSEKTTETNRKIIQIAHARANRNPIIIYECPCDVEKKHKHHWDYEKPNEVLLLCPKCHGAEHRRLNNLKHLHVVTDVTG